MSATNTISSNSFIFAPKKTCKKSRRMATLLFALAMVLHGSIALHFLTSSKNEPKKPPMIMEVSMVTITKPEPPKPEIKEPPPPPPVVKPVAKKEIAKAKPIIKPNAPVKKEIVKKIAAAPLPTHQKLLESQDPQIEEKIQQYEVAPEVTTQPPAPAIAPKVSEGSKEVNKPDKQQKVAGDEQDDVVSGGTCENCSSIKKRLNHRYERRNFSGSISFELTIDETGHVKNIVIKQIEPPADVFDEDTPVEIKESLMEMEFEPKIRNGKAESFKTIQSIKFSKNIKDY